MSTVLYLRNYLTKFTVCYVNVKSEKKVTYNIINNLHDYNHGDQIFLETADRVGFARNHCTI